MLLQELQYSLDSDLKVFCKTSIKNEQYSFDVEACTVAGSKDGKAKKPNEDAFSLLSSSTILQAAVFDGTSNLKPIQFLKNQTGARFASHFLKKELEKKAAKMSAKAAIRFLNNVLLSNVLQFEEVTLNDVHTLPSSTATLVQLLLDEEVLNVSHVGDSFCIVLFKDNNTKFITSDRNKEYDDEILAHMKRLSTEKHITPRETRKNKLIEKAIADMFQHSFNKPDGTGQGIINGNPYAERYIQDITIPLKSVKALLVGTDGIIPPGWNEQKSEDQNRIFQVIQEDGLEKLIRTKLDIENADPDFNLLRFKHSDAATGIYIKITQ